MHRPRHCAREAQSCRNVTAILKGSDPELSKTYILVTAHYDHIGMKATGDGDRIYNGANDDAGSGTVSVIGVGHAAFATMNRASEALSILFLAFFGEDEGLLGSTLLRRAIHWCR